jgi:NADH-quinone oxidoreductase subunit C
VNGSKSVANQTETFDIVTVGSAVTDGTAPRTPTNVPHRGGAPNPSADALRQQFGDAILRTTVVWGETTVFIDRTRAGEIIRWLHDDASQQYDYLADVTCVEYREVETPIEVVWHLRSLPYRRFLRIKAEIEKGTPLEIDSVWGIYRGADWLERECYDMFGIRFIGHPDLRRLLMWEQYKEGYPLRKDFPLRGRFSRSEQLRQALAANPESRYSMEELTVAEAFTDIPDDMRRRLASGERTGE